MNQCFPGFDKTIQFVQNIVPMITSLGDTLSDQEVQSLLQEATDDVKKLYDEGVISTEYYASGALLGLEEDISPGRKIAEAMRPQLLRMYGEEDCDSDPDYPSPAFVTGHAQKTIAKYVDAYYERGIAFMRRLVNEAPLMNRVREAGEYTREMIKVTLPHFMAEDFVYDASSNVPGYTATIEDYNLRIGKMVNILSTINKAPIDTISEQEVTQEFNEELKSLLSEDGVNAPLFDDLLAELSQQRKVSKSLSRRF